jgi:alpha,alpha-trehalase
MTSPHVLREYSLLADGERGILVGPDGDFAWMCFPRWDGDPVFSSLLGGTGVYAITPADRFVWGGYYEPPGLIWRSRWVTGDSIIECREALALPTAPTRAVVLRRVIAQAGTARVTVRLDLRDGRRRLRCDENGVWHGGVGDTRFALDGAGQAHAERDAVMLDLELEAGRHHDLVLVLDTDADPAPPPPAEWAWHGTEDAWRTRVPELANTAAPRDARHAYAVMSGLTGQRRGMVAAATTSLPERAAQGRNYDYRYVWLRDQCYAGIAVARAGGHALLDDAVAFVSGRLLEDGDAARPAYRPDGGHVPEERSLGLPGYPGGFAKSGNWVTHQFQLDVFGEALLLFAAAAEHDRLDADGWHAGTIAADAIGRRWREPDAGVWELEQATWTHSRLICVAGLRALGRRAGAGEPAAKWMTLADAVLADTAARATHPSGRWQRADTDERLDAALLLAAIRGAVPADDPRSVATLAAVERELTEDGYCYRYRPDERPLGEAEGAFLLCGFWLALAHRAAGDDLAAARWFERNRAACGPPGLFAEEWDVQQRQLRGNLPQAFVHALMLECAADQYGPRPYWSASRS